MSFRLLDKIKVFFARKRSVKQEAKNNYELTKKHSVKRKISRDELINHESQLGAQLFGQIPHGHRREFFQSHENVWIWFESWKDKNGYHEQTVRYENKKDGVYKKIAPGKYIRLEHDELQNFRCAVHLYKNVVKQRIYN